MSRLRPEDTTPGPGRVFTLLPIGADLLPQKAATSRAGRSRRLVALGVVLAAVVVVAGAFLLSLHARSSADSRLTAAQDQQRSLQVQSRSFDDVVSTKAQATHLRDTLRTLMKNDTPWSTLLASLGRVRGGVTFTAVQSSLTDPTAAASLAAAVTTGPAVTGAIGTLSISGTAADKPTIAAFVDALGRLDGLADPFLSTVTAVTGDGGGYSFTVSVSLTHDLSSAVTSRWTTTTGGGK